MAEEKKITKITTIEIKGGKVYEEIFSEFDNSFMFTFIDDDIALYSELIDLQTHFIEPLKGDMITKKVLLLPVRLVIM